MKTNTNDFIKVNDSEQTFTDTDSMLNAFGLNYEVGKRQSYLAGTNLVDGIPVQGRKVPNQFAVCHIAADGTATPLGEKTGAHVTESYQCIQNHEGFGIINGMIESGAKPVRYGVLDGGKKAMIELDLGAVDIAPVEGDEGRKANYGYGNTNGHGFDPNNPGTNSKGQAVGDIINRRLTVIVAHDGTNSIKAWMSYERLICLNGLRASHKASTVSIRHSKGYQDQLIEAKRVLGIAKKYYEWFEHECQKMYTEQIDHATAKSILDRLYPDPANKPDGSKPKRNGAKVRRDDIFARFQNGLGTYGKTMWDLYNGITEHFDHKDTKRSATAVYASATWGSDGKNKDGAFDLLTRYDEILAAEAKEKANAELVQL